MEKGTELEDLIQGKRLRQELRRDLHQEYLPEGRLPAAAQGEAGNKGRKYDRTCKSAIESLLYRLPDGKYLINCNPESGDDKNKETKSTGHTTTYNPEQETYVLKKRTGRDRYGRELPVVELDPLQDSVPLTRNNMPYGVRGYCFPARGESYVHIDDIDTYRVNYHENLHMRIYRTSPNHPEWEIRMLEDWRLGEEKR
ncbi:MAG: hypothetical protein R6U32_00185 [Candidatus Woesearchaeota archaeon]